MNAEKTEQGPIIGFIGQGYVGKSYADDFESRGFSVVRYAKEEPYADNRNAVKEADVVFIAVPTPTRKGKFDDTIVRSVIPLVGKGKIAVIKSTLVPGTLESIQSEHPDIIALHSPEFLSVKTAKEDASSPRRNIIGIPEDTERFRSAAQRVMQVLPRAPFELICSAKEAELIKYANNAFFYTKVVFMNVLYDLAATHGLPWDNIRSAMANEPWIGSMHIDPVHKSGRGAGGGCLIKDFAAFLDHYYEVRGEADAEGVAFLRAIEAKNKSLLTSTEKDIDLLRDAYEA